MNTWMDEHRKHPARPLVMTLTGMIVVFGSFLLLLLCGVGGAGSGSGNGTGAGHGRGDGEGSGERTLRSSADNAGHPGKQTSAVSGNGKISGKKTVVNVAPVKKNPVPEVAGPVRQPRKLIPYQVPAPMIPAAGAADHTGTPAVGTGSGRNRSAAGGGSFYGIRSRGNTLYIVDISGSMSSCTAEGPSRMEILKQQLVSAVRGGYGKGSTAKYSVIAFSSGFRVFPEGQLQACYSLPGDMKKLENFADGLACGGGTCMLPAWQEACRLLQKSRVDTIYFLTDGEPTDCSAKDLVRCIQRNISRRTIIHAIVIGGDSRELRQLAEQYHGNYRSIR